MDEENKKLMKMFARNVAEDMKGEIEKDKQRREAIEKAEREEQEKREKANKEAREKQNKASSSRRWF